MSNIYKWWIHYLYPNLVIFFHPIESLNRIYPFDMMDNIYYIDDDEYIDNINPLFEEKIKIVDKICKYEKLNKNDLQYLETLSVSELMKYIRVYNDNLIYQ
jgi:hypothetical protein